METECPQDGLGLQVPSTMNLVDALGTGVPSREGGWFFKEVGEDVFRDMFAVGDDGVNVFIEPGVVDGPEAVVAFVFSPGVFDEPFAWFFVRIQIDADECHGVVGGSEVEARAISF